MQLPSVNFCLVCEGVRPEPDQKANILGFYGVLPHVRIILKEKNKPVQALVFLVGLGGPCDEVKIAASILNPDGTVLHTSGAQPFPPLPERMSGLAAFAFVPVQFKTEGSFSLRVEVEGSVGTTLPFDVQFGLSGE